MSSRTLFITLSNDDDDVDVDEDGGGGGFETLGEVGGKSRDEF